MCKQLYGNYGFRDNIYLSKGWQTVCITEVCPRGELQLAIVLLLARTFVGGVP